tara:strand:- start:1097 stop:2116 length:1020 start_codon:yes stop_codon:yes gene_type:complete
MSEELSETETSSEDQFFGVKSRVKEEPVDDSDVEIIDDTPEEDRKPSKQAASETNEYDDDVTEEELQSYSQKVQKRINKLRAVNHADRRKRGEAERTLTEHERVTVKLHDENQKLKKLLRQGETAIIDSVGKKTALEINKAEEEFKSAHESGDTQKIADAQKALTDAQIRQRDIVGRSQRLKNAPPVEDTPPPITQRPQLSEAQVKWQSANPWFQPTAREGEQVPALHKEMTAVGYAIHDTLTRELGIDPVANESRYYSEIDKRIRTRFPDYFGEDEVEREPTVSRPTSNVRSNTNVVAPSKRNNGAKTRKLRLTTSQADVAKKLGITKEQYAAEYIKM